MLTIFMLNIVNAKVCVKSCTVGAYGVAYGWNQPDGTKCGGAPLNPKATVYYAYALADGNGGAFVVESGTTVATSISC